MRSNLNHPSAFGLVPCVGWPCEVRAGASAAAALAVFMWPTCRRNTKRSISEGPHFVFIAIVTPVSLSPAL